MTQTAPDATQATYDYSEDITSPQTCPSTSADEEEIAILVRVLSDPHII